MKFRAARLLTWSGGFVVLVKKVVKLWPTLIVVPGRGKSMNGLRVVPSGVLPLIADGVGAAPPPIPLNSRIETPSPEMAGILRDAACDEGIGTAANVEAWQSNPTAVAMRHCAKAKRNGLGFILGDDCGDLGEVSRIEVSVADFFQILLRRPLHSDGCPEWGVI